MTANLVSQEEVFTLWAIRPQEVVGNQTVRAALPAHACAPQPCSGVPPLWRAEEQSMPITDVRSLGNFEVEELSRLRDRRPHRPAEQVIRPGVTDDPTSVRRSMVDPGRNKEVVASGPLVAECPRISPGLRLTVSGHLVPTRIGLQQEPVDAFPRDQVGRTRRSDSLNPTVLPSGDSRIEEHPDVAGSNYAPGPGREIVEGPGIAGAHGVGKCRPRAEVGGDRVPDRRGFMTQVGIAK